MAALAAAFPAILSAGKAAFTAASGGISALSAATGGVSNLVGALVPAAGAVASIQQGKSEAKHARRVAEYEAKELEKEGARQRSERQRVALNERERAERVMSRQTAVAANSGAGVYNPTVLDLMADVAAEGDYRQGVALAQGESALRGYQDKAALRRASGEADYQGSLLEGYTSAVRQAPKAFDSFAAFKGGKGASDEIGDWDTTVYYG